MKKTALLICLVLICTFTACDISNLPMANNCDHSFTVVASKLPTCTKAGDSTLECNKCGYSVRAQISALGHSYVETQDTEGVSIEYTCRNCSYSYTSYLLPSVITAESFDKYIAIPLIEEYTALVNEYTKRGYDFFNDSNYTAYAPGNIINLKGYTEVKSVMSDKYYKGFIDFVNDTKGAVYRELDKDSEEYREIVDFVDDINNFLFKYDVMNPTVEKETIETYKKFLNFEMFAKEAQDLIDWRQRMLDDMYNECPVTKDGVVVYKWDDTKYGDAVQKRLCSNLIKRYCTDFSFNIKYEQETLCTKKG